MLWMPEFGKRMSFLVEQCNHFWLFSDLVETFAASPNRRLTFEAHMSNIYVYTRKEKLKQIFWRMLDLATLHNFEGLSYSLKFVETW